MRAVIRLLSATCAGTALLACGSVGVAPPPAPAAYPLADEGEQLVTALEQACLRDPLNPGHWEHLAQALERQGQGARAALMRRQAQSLRAHDAASDYALLAGESAAPAAARTPRTEVVAIGGAMVQLRRVVAGAPPASPSPASPALAEGNLPVRLEISNGNGVTGMAAALARTMRGDDVKVVRLTNVRPYAVPVSRIEYQVDQQAAAQALAARLGMTASAPLEGPQRAEVRIVLGRDMLSAAVLRQRYLK
ncbi:LytR C-terminal domain-containing protein [Rugamonas apoptosis]|uniref:LytR C-terminal domain-containing protein n=1 Tax=Rugamonas apoptosis TaxID=2758570 RepID=A0A7W2F623_9BURK|nr:LytR C-terminal domain-containing protein [Rugamonas apoptosis]MBA5685734.1 LytR C-terminal domain-containing protein [Rugamonas apoptosis]